MRKQIVLRVFLVVLMGTMAGKSFAVMPPEVYRQTIEQSRIKAVATVDRVKTTHTGWHFSSQTTSFTLITPYFKTSVPQHFSGTSDAELWPWQKPDAGGKLYFYPKKGDSVFVTISQDGGTITSYTIASKPIVDALENTPEKIRFGLGNAFVE
jgi:hypothetical protein